MTETICVASFNVLADGLSEGEFFCDGSDVRSTNWSVRKDRVFNTLKLLLQECCVVATQENDHFFWYLEQLGPTIGGVWGVNTSVSSRARELSAKRRQTTNVAKTDGACEQFSCNDGYSFLSESANYGAFMAGLYGAKSDDKYLSDDGLGIYYRKDLISLKEASSVGCLADEISSQGDSVVVNGVDCCLRATFSFVSNPSKQITIYAAHLKSGEEYSKERVRCTQLTTILEDAKGRPCPIVLMDSNNSIHYEAGYLQDEEPASSPFPPTTSAEPSNAHHVESKRVLSQVINNYGYVDAVGPEYQPVGNECFKLRHGQGGQASKHYQFMFDTIDKILVPKDTTVVPTPYDRVRFGFQRYDPALQPALLKLRTSSGERQRFQEECRTSPRISATTCAVTAFGEDHMLAGLYPNPRAPSDHPPVSCTLLV